MPSYGCDESMVNDGEAVIPDAWRIIAKEAARRLSQRPAYGSVLARRNEVATELGTTGQSLRNYLAASNFLERVEKVDRWAAPALEDLAASVVLEYERWARTDWQAAIAHAVSAKQRKLSGRAAMAEIKSIVNPPSIGLDVAPPLEGGDARGRAAALLERAGLPPVALEHLHARPAELPLARAAGVGRVLGWRVDEEMLRTRRWQHPRVAEFFRTRTTRLGDSRTLWDVVGVIKVPPSPIEDMPARVAKTVLSRATLAATLYPLVLVLLPGEASLLRFLGSLPPMPELELGLEPHAFGPRTLTLSAALGAIAFEGGGIEQFWLDATPL